MIRDSMFRGAANAMKSLPLSALRTWLDLLLARPSRDWPEADLASWRQRHRHLPRPPRNSAGHPEGRRALAPGGRFSAIGVGADRGVRPERNVGSVRGQPSR